VLFRPAAVPDLPPRQRHLERYRHPGRHARHRSGGHSRLPPDRPRSSRLHLGTPVVSRSLSTGWFVLALIAALALFGWHQPALARSETGQPEVLGDVHFASSCNAEAQAELDRAVALLHSFWRGPTLQSFSRVAELDDGCGIAYWGVAMAALVNP